MSDNKLSYTTKNNFAEGGMAILYTINCQNGQKAILRELRKRYICRPSLRARFIRGIKIRQELSPHPNLANSLQIGNNFFTPYEIIEKVSGDNLKVLINRRSEAVKMHYEEILVSAAKSLAYMHKKDYLHLDVKPENFLVDSSDRLNPVVKLTDFDLACTPIQARKLRQAGTPAYMAPEQFIEKMACKASDVFAFGIMAYHLIAGRFPFSGNSEKQTMRNQASSKVKAKPLGELAPDISPRLEKVIMKCLEKSLRDRYSNMNNCLQELGFSEL